MHRSNQQAIPTGPSFDADDPDLVGAARAARLLYFEDINGFKWTSNDAAFDALCDLIEAFEERIFRLEEVGGYNLGFSEAKESCAKYCERTFMQVADRHSDAVFGPYKPEKVSGSGRHVGQAYAAAIRAGRAHG